MTLTVVLADDQTIVRDGLVTLLGLLPGIEVVGAAADGEQAVAMVAELAPDVLLTDLRMPVCDGVCATRRVRSAHPETAVVVLTTYADDASVVEALRVGAVGWLSKDADAEAIGHALRSAAAGQSTIDSAALAKLVSAGPAAPAAPPDGLTAREAEVLGLIAGGLSNSEIARPAGGQRGHGEDACQPPVREGRFARPGTGGRLRLPARARGGLSVVDWSWLGWLALAVAVASWIVIGTWFVRSHRGGGSGGRSDGYQGVYDDGGAAYSSEHNSSGSGDGGGGWGGGDSGGGGGGDSGGSSGG